MTEVLIKGKLRHRDRHRGKTVRRDMGRVPCDGEGRDGVTNRRAGKCQTYARRKPAEGGRRARHRSSAESSEGANAGTAV